MTGQGEKLSLMIKQRLAELSLDYAEAGKLCGVSADYVSKTARGDRVPTDEILLKMAHGLGLRPDKVLLAARMDTAPREARAIYQRLEAEPGEASSDRTVPVIAYVSAGQPFQWTDGGFEPGNGLDEIEAPPGVDARAARKIYAVRVRGDSMRPFLKEGATLYIKPESRQDVTNGDYVIFKDRDYHCWVKLVEFHQDAIVLKSLNPTYPDIVKRRDEEILMEKVLFIKP
jgi:phage repressor protein C with HTH and peptisase S24 domain